MSKIVAEKQAGVVSIDAFLIGPCTGNSLVKADLFEPLEPAMLLAEVKDPAKWFGGHLWADNQTGKNRTMKKGGCNDKRMRSCSANFLVRMLNCDQSGSLSGRIDRYAI